MKSFSRIAVLAALAVSGCSVNEYHGTTSFECIGGSDDERTPGAAGKRVIDEGAHPNKKRSRYVLNLIDPAAINPWWVSYPPRETKRSSIARVYINGVMYGTSKFDTYFGRTYDLYSPWGNNPEHLGTFYADQRHLELARENGPIGTSSEAASCIKHSE